MSERNPVSSSLEEALSTEVRRHGHVVWLDREGHYTGFVDVLARGATRGGFSAPVVPLRGSHLEVMLALEPLGSALERSPLLVHVPGHNKDSIRGTPLLELYESAKVFERALPTLVRDTAAGRVGPKEIERFVSAPGLTLEAADRWLLEQTSQRREGLDAQLAQVSARLLAEELLVEVGLLSTSFAGEDAPETVATHLERLLGLPPSWRARFSSGAGVSALEALRSALWSWLLCVEYVTDLRREPHLPWLRPLRELPPALVAECRACAKDLRARHPDAYVRGADGVEALFEEEQRNVAAADLGSIDTFRFEVSAIFEAALGAVGGGRWGECLAATTSRIAESFWLEREPSQRWEWTLLEAAARLGKALARAPEPLKGAESLDQAASLYARNAAPVDSAHRRLEQTRARLLESRMPHYGALKEALDGVRERYRAWADALARSWARLCGEHGFLPESSLQQWTLFEQVVEPLARSGERVAFFVVDALRYEMAMELIRDLEAPGVKVELQPRLAELPTLTAVGMNALAPVASGGRLRPVVANGRFSGFRAGEFTVTTPEQRARAMGQRLHGEAALRLTLPEVAEMDTEALRRRIAQSRGLVVVHGTEIDDAGEANLGGRIFEDALQQLRGALGHLQKVGVKQFVITADHGFLLQDDEGPVRRWGSARDPGRRHVLTAEQRQEAGTHVVSLSALPARTATSSSRTVPASSVPGSPARGSSTAATVRRSA